MDIWACGKPIPHSQLFGVKGPQLPAMVRKKHRYSLWALQVWGVCEIAVFALVSRGWLFSSHTPPQVFPGLYCILPKEGLTHALEDGLRLKRSPMGLGDMGSEAQHYQLMATLTSGITLTFWVAEPCVAFLGSSVKSVTDPDDLCSVS